MKHKWTQSYFPEGKYNRLYRAQQLLSVSDRVIELDRLEPITDLTQAQEYLKKFQLT